MNEIVETIDSLPAHKFIILFGIVPALLFFTYIYVVNPLTEFTAESITVAIRIFSILSLICIGMAGGMFLVGKGLDYLAKKMRKAYTKHMAHFIADVLTHDDEIRKRVVDGIVGGINEAMLKDSPIVIDLKQRVEKLEQEKKETDQIACEKIYTQNQSDDTKS